jgi:hypothetical protein
MTTGALLARLRFQQLMGKPVWIVCQTAAAMVGMTRGAVLFRQILMKRNASLRFRDRYTGCSTQSNVLDHMATGTTFRDCTEKRGMAGKAIVCQVLMGGNQGTRADHRMRISERKYNQCQRGQCDYPD